MNYKQIGEFDVNSDMSESSIICSVVWMVQML